MKKLVVLILALCMLCSVAFANELTWASVEETASQIAGEFKTFDEISVKIWMPDVLKAVELSDDDREGGYIGYFETEDETAAIAVQYVNVEGMSLEEYAAILSEDSEVSDLEAGTVNGLNTLSYTIPGKDTGVLAFATEMGYILEVSCRPLSDEGFASVVGIILCSIQGC